MPERKEDRGVEGGSKGEAREEEASSSDRDLTCREARLRVQNPAP